MAITPVKDRVELSSPKHQPRRIALYSPRSIHHQRRVAAEEPLHARDEVRLGRLHDPMKMVRHQAKRMHLPARLQTRLAQRPDETLPVLIVLGDLKIGSRRSPRFMT